MPAARAKVRPRVITEPGAEPIAVDALLDRLPRRPGEILRIEGGPGAGKSTCIRHLAALLETRESACILIDGPPQSQPSLGVVCASKKGPANRVWTLSPWGRDELIEYALATDPARARDVLPRALTLYDRCDFAGNPALWSEILELLFRRPEPVTVPAAIEQLVAKLSQRGRDTLTGFALRRQLGHTSDLPARVSRTGAALLRCPEAQAQLAARHLAYGISRGGRPKALKHILPPALIRACAASLDEEGRMHLRELIRGRHRPEQAMAASLLHALGEHFLVPGVLPILRGAQLDGLHAPVAALASLNALGASLVGASLTSANLSLAQLQGANLGRSFLSSACLERAHLSRASLRCADLRGANAVGAHFDAANLTGSDLRGLRAAAASFAGARLDEALMQDADLSGTILDDALLRDAVVAGANLTGAHIFRVRLGEACLAGACLESVQISHCQLEDMAFEDARLAGAVIRSSDLTAARLPSADLRNATLDRCGLADIDLEDADLRGATLRDCTFHMGSSRSGLLFTGIPCEGSRTGFYTDDLQDFTHKTPEQVRKANLRGTNLRGVCIRNTDFYLVDLRDALIDPELEPYFRKCGAILEDWT